MGTVIVIVCVGAALNLALWGALFHRLRTLPLSVWQVAQRNRAADENRALDVLQAAAASRLGGLVIGLRGYHDQLAGLARAQVAEAEVRARVTERRASDALVALDVASALVRDLRVLAEDLPSLLGRRGIEEHAAAPLDRAPVPSADERATVEVPPDEADDALAALQTRPLPKTRPLAAAGVPSSGQGGAR